VDPPFAAVSILKVIDPPFDQHHGRGRAVIAFLPSVRRAHPPSTVISSLNRYNQKPFINLIGPGQMYDVCAIPSAAGETLEVVWMWSYHHNVGSHVKLPAGRARNPLTHIHVGNAKSIEVLRPSGKAILYPLEENSFETSRVVMLGAGRSMQSQMINVRF